LGQEKVRNSRSKKEGASKKGGFCQAQEVEIFSLSLTGLKLLEGPKLQS